MRNANWYPWHDKYPDVRFKTDTDIVRQLLGYTATEPAWTRSDTDWLDAPATGAVGTAERVQLYHAHPESPDRFVA